MPLKILKLKYTEVLWQYVLFHMVMKYRLWPEGKRHMPQLPESNFQTEFLGLREWKRKGDQERCIIRTST